MQRCLCAWKPLPRARLQAAAISYTRARPFSKLSCLRNSSNITRQDDDNPDDWIQHGTSSLSAFERLQTAATSRAATGKSNTAYDPPLEGDTAGWGLDSSGGGSTSSRDHHISSLDQTWPASVPLGHAHQEQAQTTGLVRRLVSQTERVPVTNQESAERWAEEFLDGDNTRRRWWIASQWLIQHQPARVSDFLVKTCGLADLEQRAINVLVGKLISYCDGQEDYVARPIVAGLAEALQVLVHRRDQPPLRLTRHHLFILCPFLAISEVQLIYGLMKDGLLDIDVGGVMRLCRYFAREGDMEQAVDAFIVSIARGAQGDGPEDTLLYLLKYLDQRPDGFRECTRLLENLQRLDFKTTSVVSRMMQIAYKNGKYQAAVDMYRSTFGRNTEADARGLALAVLCKLFAADAQVDLTIEYIVDEGFRTGVVYDNQVIANHILHLFTMEALSTPDTAWPRIWSLFQRLFDGDLLQLLDLPVVPQPEQSSSAQRLRPSKASINTVIQAYLKLHAQGLLQESDPVDVYQRWHSLVLQGEDPFLQMALEDYTSNHFLHHFTQEPETLINATAVMKDMQTPLPESLGVTRAKPSARSWNIFLLGFEVHGKHQLADQVLQHMEREGMPRDKYTWSILVNSHARSQDLDRLLNTLNRAAEAGLQFDTLEKGLRPFHDKDALQAVLKKSAYREELDFSSELKADLAAKVEATEIRESKVPRLSPRELARKMQAAKMMLDDG